MGGVQVPHFPAPIATPLVMHILHLGEFCTETRNVTVAKDLGYVQHISFNNSDELISISVGNEVWVIEIEVGRY